MSDPGWYPDPWKIHQSRYWDGQDWTGHVQGDAVADTPALPAPASPSVSIQPFAPVEPVNHPVPINPQAAPVPPTPYSPGLAVGGQNINVHINQLAPAKSKGLAFVLTFFFGPFGMFYSTLTGGLVMLGVNFLVLIISILTLGLGFILFFILWPIEIIWAIVACDQQPTVVAPVSPPGPGPVRY